MANYGIKQFNYSNVINYKNVLTTNRDLMDNLFNKYKSELSHMEANWSGSSGDISREDMQILIDKYNGFLNKVNDFIFVLSEAENSFSESEKQTISTYNNV